MIEDNTTPVCEECPGRCCSARRWMFSKLFLSAEEARSDIWAPHAEWHEADTKEGWRAFVSLDPTCPHLQSDNRCGVYDQRPYACRSYVCYMHHSALMAMDEGKFPTHRRLLNRWKVLPHQPYGLGEEGLRESEEWAMQDVDNL